MEDAWRRRVLWPETPRDDYYFWLYVAWEFQQRQIRWPAFIHGITDLTLIA